MMRGFGGSNPFDKEERGKFQDQWPKIIESKRNKISILSNISTSHICADFRSCTACGRCIKACPKQVIGKVGSFWHKHIVIENAGNCTGCKKCIWVCPHGVFSENTTN